MPVVRARPLYPLQYITVLLEAKHYFFQKGSLQHTFFIKYSSYILVKDDEQGGVVGIYLVLRIFIVQERAIPTQQEFDFTANAQA